MPYLSTSVVVIHYEEALYQVYAPLPLPFNCNLLLRLGLAPMLILSMGLSLSFQPNYWYVKRHACKVHVKHLNMCQHTSIGHEYLNSDVLQQVSATEDCTDFTEVPFAVQVVDVLQHLRNNVRLPQHRYPPLVINSKLYVH